MSIKKILCWTTAACTAVTISASAQEWDTAYVPVTVNVDAVVTISPPDVASGVGQTQTVSAGVRKTFTVLFDADATPISYRQQKPRAAAAVKYRRGTVSLTLPAQTYGGGANVALYSVNGKRVLNMRDGGRPRTAAPTMPLVQNVQGGALPPGVYMLSVKGAGGKSYSTRLTHGGGRLTVNTIFTNENNAGHALRKSAATTDNWKITADPPHSSAMTVRHTFTPRAGQNDPVLIILPSQSESDWTPTGALFAIVEKNSAAIENADVQSVDATNVSVSWAMRPNVTKYEVYRNGKLARETSGNIIEDYGLTIGQTYEYVVAGYTDANQVTFSAPISVTPFAASAAPGTWRYMNINSTGSSSEATVTASASSNPSGVRGADGRWYQFQVTGDNTTRTFQYRRSNDGRSGWSNWANLPSATGGGGSLTAGAWVGNLNGTQTTINPKAYVASGTTWNGSGDQAGIKLEGVHWYQVHDRGLKVGEFQEGKYVLGCHREPSGNYNLAHIMLVSCYPNNGQPYGEITYSGRPFGYESRDQRLFVDTDGTAYALCSALGDSHFFKLDPEWKEPIEHTNHVFKGQYKETPDILRYGDWYFYFGSRQNGWYPSQVQYSMSRDIGGAWSALQDFGNTVTFGAQFNGIRTDRYGDGKTAYGFYSYRWSNQWDGIAKESAGNPRRFTILNINGNYVSAHWFNNIVYYPDHGYVGIRPGRNLSLGKKVTAPSGQKTGNLHAVTDGRETSNAPYYHHDASPYTITIDLEKPSVIREITVTTRIVGGSESPCQYTLSGSRDGSAYTQLADASANGQPGFVVHNITNTGEYRYIQMRVTKFNDVRHNNNNTVSWADGVYEVAVYGTSGH